MTYSNESRPASSTALNNSHSLPPAKLGKMPARRRSTQSGCRQHRNRNRRRAHPAWPVGRAPRDRCAASESAHHPHAHAQRAAAIVGLELSARAGVHTPVSACASGAEAVAQGLQMIRSGRADMVVVGGTEACIHPLPLAAFAAMRALSNATTIQPQPRAPTTPNATASCSAKAPQCSSLRPKKARKLVALHIYAEVAGAGITADGHHIAQPEPEGTWRGASDGGSHCRTPKLRPPTSYTSTPTAQVLRKAMSPKHSPLRAALGDDAANVAVTSTKSMTGHLLGAAGAVESIACILALQERLVPPTINIDNLDPAITLDIVDGQPRKLSEDRFPGAIALNNSFGFGGHNVALAFRSVP